MTERTSWVTEWKRNHIVPWTCTVCSSIVRHGKLSCTSCGKEAPKGANKKLDDAAACRIQCQIRCMLARNKLYQLCKESLKLKFDISRGEEVYLNHNHGVEVCEPIPWFVLNSGITQNSEYRKNKEQHEAKQKQKENLAKAREERLEAQEAKRGELVSREKDRQQKLLEDLWRPILKQANESHELLACWKGFTVIPDEVEEAAPNLRILRLVGNEFGTIQESFPKMLTNIVVLSLSTCKLQSIPDSICELQHLEELNLMKNELKTLPENIGNLFELQRFFISSNRLESLPASIRKLSKLPKLDLERNLLKHLPGEIVEMRATTMSWSQVTLRGLPHKLGDFPCLVSLTANNNRIKRIPTSIGKLQTLEHLSLCNNLITLIPDSLCECRNLARLWLDWNQVQTLPGSFLQLENLHSLHLEGNEMRVPEMDYIIKGVECVRQWFKDQEETATDQEFATIIKCVQRILADCVRLDLISPSIIRTGYKTDKIGDPVRDEYYGIAIGTLYTEVIPTWVNYFAEKARTEKEPEGTNATFPYTEDELIEAIENARDAYGHLCVVEEPNVWFLECGCTRGNTKRVCIPPQAGYMCERNALLIKTNYVKESEKARRESELREEEEVAIHKRDAQTEAEMYASSKLGAREFHERAVELATTATEEELRQAYAVKALAKLRKAKARSDKHRDQAIERLEQKKERRIEHLNKQQKELVLKLEGLMPAWEKEILRSRISDIDDELENLPEDAELDFIRVEAEDAEAKFKFQEKNIAAGEGYRERSEKAKAREVLSSKRHKQLTLIYEKEIVNDFVVSKMEEAEAGVRRDYALLRRIMLSWRMLNVRMTFNQWRDFARIRKKWRKKFEQAERESKELEHHNQVVQLELQKAEWKKWKRRINDFTDKEYWEHCETKEVSLVEPKVEDMVYRPPKLKEALEFAAEARRARQRRRRRMRK